MQSTHENKKEYLYILNQWDHVTTSEFVLLSADGIDGKGVRIFVAGGNHSTG